MPRERVIIMESFKYSYKTDVDDNISVNVYNCGYQKCEGGYGIAPIIRRRYLIHHVVAGKGYLVINEKTYQITEGDTFIIYPNMVVSYYADKEDPWEYYWVGFGGADVKALILRTDFTKDSPVIQTEHSGELKEILLKIYKSSGEKAYHHIQMVGYLYLFLSVLIRCSVNSNYNVDISLEYIKKAVDYVAENYEKQITVNDIANCLGVSRSHLYRVFVNHLSKSPKAYLEEYRIRQAGVLLRQTTMMINEVANSVGYEDQLHFSKMFKKLMEVSPREYRKTHRGLKEGNKIDS